MINELTIVFGIILWVLGGAVQHAPLKSRMVILGQVFIILGTMAIIFNYVLWSNPTFLNHIYSKIIPYPLHFPPLK